jgi:alcohol dehydrogenase class IV
MRFDLTTAGRIIFGPGTRKEVPALASRMGRYALVVGGRNRERTAGLIQGLKDGGMNAATFAVDREPTMEIILEGLTLARAKSCDLVIGMGGGSAIDAGKAISALMTNPGELLEYLEVIGGSQSIPNPPAPYIAIPTTAGTGTEVTRNAVIISREHEVKVSMRSDMMLPRLVVADPELTYSLPPHITASTGLDALTQLVEAFVSVKANPFTDGLCREGLVRAARSLNTVYADGGDKAAREDMMLASLFSGLALANAGLGAVHGFAAPLGGMLDAPHGVVCARLLPIVMDVNIRALAEREPGSPALTRYGEIARVLSGDPGADALQGVAWVEKTCAAMHIPALNSIGLTEKHIPSLIENAARASSMKGNPVGLTGQELEAIAQRSLTPVPARVPR